MRDCTFTLPVTANVGEILEKGFKPIRGLAGATEACWQGLVEVIVSKHLAPLIDVAAEGLRLLCQIEVNGVVTTGFDWSRGENEGLNWVTFITRNDYEMDQLFVVLSKNASGKGIDVLIRQIRNGRKNPVPVLVASFVDVLPADSEAALELVSQM
jgi:hypothetical protein